MLVLTRREGEAIVIVDKVSGETVTISIERHQQRAVRIGITASHRFQILRAELLPEQRATDGHDSEPSEA